MGKNKHKQKKQNNMEELETKKALQVIDFWFAIEFLNQASLSNYYKIGNSAYKYKQSLLQKKKTQNEKAQNETKWKKRTKKPETLAEFIEIKENTDISTCIAEDMKLTSFDKHTDFTLFIGRIKREDCVQKIARHVDWEDMRPEPSDGDIALATIRFDKEGNVIEGSLSISPLAWAVSKLSDGITDVSSKLDSEQYEADRRELEGKIFDLLSPSDEEDIDGDTEEEKVGEKRVLADITFDLLQEIEALLYEQLWDDSETPKSFFALSFKLYAKEEDMEDDEEVVNLHFDCFSDDLALVAKQLRNGSVSAEKRKQIEDYILGVCRESATKRIDVVRPETQGELYRFLTETLTAKKAPIGKWPSKFMPALMQQIAVNLATDEDNSLPVFSVNGPPGTGKTTLLKEIIVNHVIEKAILLSNYTDPDEAFETYGFLYGEGEQHSYNKWVKKYHRLKNSKITDYSILVASSNNTAVENITKELPIEEKLLKDINPDGVKMPENYAALSELCDLFTVSKSTKEVTYTEEKWEEYTNQEGEKKYRKVQVSTPESDIYFSKLATSLLNDEFGKKKEEQAFGLISASLGRKANITKVEENIIVPLVNVVMKKNESIDEAKKDFIDAKEAFLDQVETVRNYQKNLDDLGKQKQEQRAYEKGFILDEAYVGAVLSEDVDVSTDAHVQNPWFSEHYNREREKLFWHALQITKYFILGSKKCRDNFKHLDCLWSGSYSDGVSVRFEKEDLENVTVASFETLFLLIPVISSTFASVQNLFRNVKEENVIGTLIVDEAGQASPHMALGALYRCKKAIIVGDPKQVEPVVTDDQDLLKKTYTDEMFRTYANKTNSVQRFADIMNPYGTYLENSEEEKEWVGCPLLVHRRCTSPMYDISNDISYNNIMKQKTLPPKEKTVATFIYPQSQWINVIGKETGKKNHFVVKQAEKVIELLGVACEKSEKLDLYIISPFKSVVDGIQKYIREYKRKNPESVITKIPDRWISDSIGTVHKFQGKEAAEVIFLLGCDTSQGALPAIRWVNNNIVNVAATRAKYRLYIVGDIQAWKASKCVTRAKAIIDTYAFELMDQELQKDKPDGDRLKTLCKQIPSSSAFPIEVTGDKDGSEIECITSTEEMLTELEKANIMMRPLTNAELKRFGFQDMDEIRSFSQEVQSNLLWGMKLYLLLEKTYTAIDEEMDASCCGILFCKAMELQMHHCFVEMLKQHFPAYEMRVLKGKDAASNEILYLKDADMEEFTLGWYPAFIKKQKNNLGQIMRDAGYEKYDSVWWDDFKSKLFKCKEERNSCCHTKKFYWSNLESLIASVFYTSETKHNNELGGLLFESKVGLYMKQ